MKFLYAFFVFILMASHSFAEPYEQTLKSASELSYPPFSIITHDNQADGFSVELLRSVTYIMGLDVDFQIDEWNIVKNDLQSGNLDVLPLVGRTPEREAYFDFTVPYLSMHGTVVVRKDGPAIKSLSDLSGKKLLVMSGDNAHEYLLRTKITQHIIETKTFEEAFRKLSAGQYDGVVVQKLVGIQLIKSLELTNLKTVDFMIKELRQDFCFAVREGDKELIALLNEGLSSVMASGIYEQLYNKWFSFLIEDNVQYQQSAYLLIIITIVLLVLIGLSIVWQRTLQHSGRVIERDTDSGNPIHLDTHQDITERIQVELKQKGHYEQLQLLLENINGISWELDLSEGTFTYVSPSAERILGYPIESWVNMDSWVSMVLPEDRK